MNNKIIEELNYKIDNQEKIIRELQEENEFLQEELTKSDSLVKELCMNTEEENAEDFRKCLEYLKDYKNRVDKAIEYIEENGCYCKAFDEYGCVSDLLPYECDELLEILKGEDNE